MIQEGKDRRDVSLLHWVRAEGEALLQLLFLRNVQVKKARPRLRDYESWLPLAAEAKSRNLGPIFFIISVQIGAGRPICRKILLFFHVSCEGLPGE